MLMYYELFFYIFKVINYNFICAFIAIYNNTLLLSRNIFLITLIMSYRLSLFKVLMPYRDAFFELVRLLLIALSIPATSAGCERSFSKMKLIKSVLRNSMLDERLRDLAILSINAERAARLDLDVVVDIFAKKHMNSRILLM